MVILSHRPYVRNESSMETVGFDCISGWGGCVGTRTSKTLINDYFTTISYFRENNYRLTAYDNWRALRGEIVWLTVGYKFVCLFFITAVVVHDVGLTEARQPLSEMNHKINLVVNLLQQCTTLLQLIANAVQQLEAGRTGRRQCDCIVL